MPKKLVIIGGVAGGANVATRARRLSEDTEITIIERGPYVSFANCGLPYHIGGEIPKRDKLLIHTPQSIEERFGVNVYINTEAIFINRTERKLEVRTGGETKSIPYDNLVIATGAAAIKPPLSGISGGGVFALRDMDDMDNIIQWIAEKNVSKAIVVGGGYIGVEVAEQLAHLKKEVFLVEGNKQILAPLDPEMAGIAESELKQHMKLLLSSRLKSIDLDAENNACGICLENGEKISGQIVILGLGVVPEVTLAKNAGLELGTKGGIKVNEFLQTSDPLIYAVGDAIEVRNFVTGVPALIALAGPANRQGRMAADNIFLDQKKKYEGTLGTAVVRVFSKTAACTGANEKTLKSLNIPYEKLYLFSNSHAGYFPGAKEIAIKILFSPEQRKLLGAQAVGEVGADKRIDIFATAIKGGLTIDEIAELELCYAPPVGSAKDPVNMAGMMMQNVADGLVSVVGPADLSGYILDVRDEAEVEKLGSMPGSTNIPLNDIRDRISEIPKDRKINVYCQSGQRSYNAVRKLMQLGYDAVNITGAYKAYLLFNQTP